MTSLPIVFHPDVEHDLAEIFDRYDLIGGSLTQRFEVRLGEHIERIVDAAAEHYEQAEAAYLAGIRDVRVSTCSLTRPN